MSAICVDPRGERAIVNYRDDRLADIAHFVFGERMHFGGVIIL